MLRCRVALLRKGCDRAASGHPGRGEGTIEGPIGPGRCEPITGRPWVPIARLYSAPARAGPPPEPARPPPGKRPPRRGARAALARTIEGQFGAGPTGRVDRTPTEPSTRPYSARAAVRCCPPPQRARAATGARACNYRGLLCGLSNSHTVVLVGLGSRGHGSLGSVAQLRVLLELLAPSK